MIGSTLLLQLFQVTAALIAVRLLVFLALRYYRWLTTPLRQIPGPPVSSFWIGYAHRVFVEPFLKSHKQWWADLRVKHDGSVPLLAYNMEFGRFSVLLLDPDIVKEVFTSQASRFPLRFPKHPDGFIRSILGDGLVTLEGHRWHRHRRIIQPSFYTRGLQESLDQAVPKHTSRFIKAWKNAQAGRVIDVSSHLSALTIDILGDVAFAHDFNAIDTVEKWAAADSVEEKLDEAEDPLIKALHDALQPNLWVLTLFVLGLDKYIQYLEPKLNRACRLLNKAVDGVVQAARATNKNTSSSLLHTLFDAEDTSSALIGASKVLSDKELRDEVKTFVVAGHETTSTLCYWALYALAKYPHIQQRVYDDILKRRSAKTSSSSSSNEKNEETIHLEDIDRMDYFNAFINEVLRLYPPIVQLQRYTSQQEQFGKYTIPARTKIFISIHLIHRHPDHWKNALEFMPERWLNKDEVNARHRYAYLPFGGGGRNCIGQNFALMEGKLMMANLIAAFRIELAPSLQNLKVEFTSIGTLKGKPEVKICIKSR